MSLDKTTLLTSLLSLVKPKKNNVQDPQGISESSTPMINTQDSVSISSGAKNNPPSVAVKSIGDEILDYVSEGLSALFSKGPYPPNKAVAEAIITKETNKAIKTVSKEMKAKSVTLENKADELKSKEKVLDKETSDYRQQKDAIRNALKEQGLSDEKIDLIISAADQEAALNVQGCEQLLENADKLSDRALALKGTAEFLEWVKVVVKISGNRVAGLEQVMDKYTKTQEKIISSMTPGEILQSNQIIAKSDVTLHEIAGGRADLLAKIDAHNMVLAKMIADKILPPEKATEADYANASQFVNKISELPIFTIAPDLTRKILAMIDENNAMNERADKLVYEKQLKEKKDRQIQELKVAIRTTIEKLDTLKKLEQQEFAAGSKDETQKILTEIISQLQKKTKSIV